MPLSVLSAIARLDLDPWEQAEILAGLPAGEAVRTLRAMLSRLPGSTTCPELEAVCDRAVSLLPREPMQSKLKTLRANRPATSGASSGMNLRLVLLTLGMMLVSVTASELLARPTGPASSSAARAGSATSVQAAPAAAAAAHAAYD